MLLTQTALETNSHSYKEWSVDSPRGCRN